MGVLVSAPMGPIGALCIQRTLNKGRWHGFVTGVGAMLSDVVYAVMVGMGMSFIVNFISSFKDIIQIMGSALLLGFGVFLFRSNPIKALRQQRKNITTYTQDFVTAFLLTLSNPLIIFLFIALFARLNFYNADFSFGQHILGFVSIAVGALLWWLLVTTLFGKLRDRINLRRLWVVNRVIAGIIIAISLIGLIYSTFAEVKTTHAYHSVKHICNFSVKD